MAGPHPALPAVGGDQRAGVVGDSQTEYSRVQPWRDPEELLACAAPCEQAERVGELAPPCRRRDVLRPPEGLGLLRNGSTSSSAEITALMISPSVHCHSTAPRAGNVSLTWQRPK